MKTLEKAYLAVQEAHHNLQAVARETFPPGIEIRWTESGSGVAGTVVRHVKGYRVIVRNSLTGDTKPISLWRCELDGRKIADLFEKGKIE